MKYVVIKRNWEYNDQNYYRGESGGGEPILVFSNKTKAEAYTAAKNMGGMRGLQLVNFYEDPDELFKIEVHEFIELWNETFDTEYHTGEDQAYDIMWELEIPKQASAVQIKTIRGALKDVIDDYVIHEVKEND